MTVFIWRVILIAANSGPEAGLPADAEPALPFCGKDFTKALIGL